MDWGWEQVTEAQNRKKFTELFFLGNTVGLCVFLLVLLWATVLTFGGISLSSVPGKIGIHSSLMVFTMLYGQGIGSLIYRLLPKTRKSPLKFVHAGVHFVGVAGSAAGLVAAIAIHNSEHPPNHFYSLHSWLGISTIGTYYLQFLGGFSILLIKLTPKSFRLWVLPAHKALGKIVLCFACGAVLTGLFRESSRNTTGDNIGIPVTGIVLNTAGLLTVIYTFIIGYLLTDSRFRRPQQMENNPILQQSQRNRIRIYSGPSTRA